MSRYMQIYYHIVFSTKERAPVLAQPGRKDLFRYIWGIIRETKSHLYRINGTMDHVHVLSSLYPTVSLSDFVKQVKGKSSYWIKKNHIFAEFTNWQDGYGAFTHSSQDKDRLIEYIKRQEERHRSLSFDDELKDLLIEADVDFDERYLTQGES